VNSCVLIFLQLDENSGIRFFPAIPLQPPATLTGELPGQPVGATLGPDEDEHEPALGAEQLDELLVTLQQPGFR